MLFLAYEKNNPTIDVLVMFLPFNENECVFSINEQQKV